jgi:hypothetical protein
MTLLSSLVILSVICSGVANGLGRVAASAVPPAIVVILAALTYPIVGDELKSSVMVDMIGSSDALIAPLSPRTL